MGYKRLCQEYWYKEKKHAEFSISCSFPAVGKFLVSEKCLYRKRTCFLLGNEPSPWGIWLLFLADLFFIPIPRTLLQSFFIIIIYYCSGRNYTCVISVLAVNTIPSHQAALIVSRHWGSLYCLTGSFLVLWAHISPLTVEVKILTLSSDCQPLSMHYTSPKYYN